MSDDAALLFQNHRDRRWLVSGIMLSLMAASLMARNERALFIDAGLVPRVFAVVPGPFSTLPLVDWLNEPLPRAFLARTSPPAGAAGLGNPPAPGTLPDLADPFAAGPVAQQPLSLATLAPANPDAGFTPGNFPNFTTPADGTASPAAPITAPVATMPGLPEPAAWITMLSGFALVGTIMRRARGGARAVKLSPAP